ncbi:MAG: hypothetical protein IT445_07445 [Phycisphaeraceae bacterium]|nr:hypothetical protein [Phycisphaeraceae bacterium]
MTQQLPPIPQRPYVADDVQAQIKPVYRFSDDPPSFTRNVRFVAIDVMILTFTARRHTEWLASIGVCPDDVARLISSDLDAIARLITPPPAIEPVSPQPPDVGPRPKPAARPKDSPTSLWAATRGDVGETGADRAEGVHTMRLHQEFRNTPPRAVKLVNESPLTICQRANKMALNNGAHHARDRKSRGCDREPDSSPPAKPS